MSLAVTVREGRGSRRCDRAQDILVWPGPKLWWLARSRQVAVFHWLRGGFETPPPALHFSWFLSVRSCSSSQRPPAFEAAVSPTPYRRC